MLNVQSKFFIISFFPVQLLYVDSFQKLIFRSFNFNGLLGSQAVKFELLKINKNLFYHLIILYILAKKRHFLLL